MSDLQGAAGGMSIGPWIISGIALVQVWVIALWKRYFRKAQVGIYESGNIEIGYSNLGPTIGLVGTLRTLHQDVFVKRIVVELVKAKDSAYHTLNWRAFRPNTISLNPAEPIRFEIASSFLLASNNPFKFNIVFADDDFIADISPRVGNISQVWHEYRTKKMNELEARLGDKDKFDRIAQSPNLEQILWDQLMKDGVLTNQFVILDRACYWEAGEYLMTVNIECERPTSMFSKEYFFTLTDDDEKLLRLNAITILRVLSGFSDQVSFAYRKYNTK